MKTIINAFLLIFMILGVGCHSSSSNTKYGVKYNEQEFRSLKKGDLVDDALASLGPPLLIQSWNSNGASKSLIGIDVDLKSPDYNYLLVYSMQVNGRRAFERRSLVVAKGVIVSITAETVSE